MAFLGVVVKDGTVIVGRADGVDRDGKVCQRLHPNHSTLVQNADVKGRFIGVFFLIVAGIRLLNPTRQWAVKLLSSQQEQNEQSLS